jgi:poly(A) polymerase
MRNIGNGEVVDPLGSGLADLEARILRTPCDPDATFIDDPLRMLRAVRFRWKLGFEPAEGLYASIQRNVDRLKIISWERIRDELMKMLDHPTRPEALSDLMSLGLFHVIAPELVAMVDCEQGRYHHLDVWNHTLLVMKNAGASDRTLTLAALFHDIGKPPTRSIDEQGNTRFFGHESVGATLTDEVLRRWKLPQREIDPVVRLVKNHMRLGHAPILTASAARRILRDLGEDLDRLLELVDADCRALKPGVRIMDLSEIRVRLQEVQAATPHHVLESPLSGIEIMALTGLPAGREIGRLKQLLTEKVLEGILRPDDKSTAANLIQEDMKNQKGTKD